MPSMPSRTQISLPVLASTATSAPLRPRPKIMPRAIIGVDTVSLNGYVQATSRLVTLALVIWLFGKNREPSAGAGVADPRPILDRLTGEREARC